MSELELLHDIKQAAYKYVKENPTIHDASEIRCAFIAGAISDEAKALHGCKPTSTNEEFYVLFETSPGVIWQGKTKEVIAKFCNGEPIWLEPSSGTTRNQGTGKDEWVYKDTSLILVPANRIFFYEPI